jgi:tetratricopeptide (TPR) repeat protein
MTLGRREEAWTVLKDATALAESTGNLGTQSVALDNLGEIARDRGDYRQSRALCEQAVEVAEQTGVPSRIGWTLTKLGRIRLLQGEWLAARDTIERAVGLLKPGTPEGAPGGSTGPLAYLRIHLGELDLLEGNWERGVAEVNAVAAGAHSRRDRWLLRYAQRLLAEQELFQGQPAAALARLVPLLAPTAADEPQSGLLFAPLARAHLDLGEEERAESVLAEGQERLHAQGFRTAQADLLCVEGMLRASQGRRQEAKEVLEEAIELARSMPDPYREAQARAVLGSLAARLGDSTSAKDHLLEALAIAESLGARPCAARIRSALAQAGPPR